jgi:hypothetical protein
MKLSTILLGTAVLTPVLLAFRPPATRIRFAPAEGSSVTKTYEQKVRLALDNYSMEGLGGMQQPDMELTLTSNQKVVVTDEYKKLRDGAPAELKRSFDEVGSDMAMSMKMEAGGQSQSTDSNVKAGSELNGKKVVFTWDAEKKEYTKAFDPTLDKEDLLKGLQEDMDLRAFLPAEEVKEGDEWEIDPKALAGILSPGGDLSFVPEGDEADMAEMGAMGSIGSMSAEMAEQLTGTVKAKLIALRDVEGAQMAVIKLEINVESKADMTETAQEQIKKQDLPEAVSSIEIEHLDVEWKLEAEGELTWNLAAGHFHTLEISGTSNLKTDNGIAIEVQGRKMNMNETREMSGTTTYSAKAD